VTAASTSDPTIRWYTERYSQFERSLNGEKSSEFHSLRTAGIAAFAKLGFPSTRHEEWRFTNIAPITGAQFQPVPTGTDERAFRSAADEHALDGAHRLVFIDGHFAPTLSDVSSLPAGVVLTNLRSAMKAHAELLRPHLAGLATSAENAFTALNAAFLLDGAVLSVPKGVAVERPVQFLFLATRRQEPALIQPRNLVIAGAGSRVTLAETYVAADGSSYLTNSVTEMWVGANAVVEHDRLQLEQEQAFHVGTLQVRQEQDSIFTSNAINLGGALTRNTITAVLNGRHAECTLNGLSLGTGTQLLDSHTAIDHAMPDCASHELYKSILDGKSRGVFNGKIFVRKDAQKTDAKQTNKTLLLSDEATMDTKPQLEIFADDVKCTHGATIGQLDEEQVFYLRSRGLGEVEARDMLTYAFAGDVIERIHLDPLKAKLEALLHARLDRGRASA
jgi:Fe-S cluster assembly protein SufD